MRKNMVEHCAEAWQPPQFAAHTAWEKRLHRIRCFFDLQAGSVWNDLSEELPQLTGRTLDVGCGGQPYRSLLPGGAAYVGIDIADSQAHFGYKLDETLYYRGEVWPVEDDSFDSVLCTETLEHVADPAVFLDQAARVLRDEGQMILTVPFAARWHFIPYDYWRYTPSGLQRLLEAAGFTNIVVHARGNAVTVAAYKVMALMLPLLFPQHGSPTGRWGRRLLGVPLIPAFVLLAGVGNLSLRGSGGDDCLGYTVFCTRRSRGPADLRL